MKEQLISFDTAKLAKEKGFNEICNYAHSEDDKGIIDKNKNHNYQFRNDSMSDEVSGYISAPTQALLQAWLRTKEIFLYVIVEDHGTFRYEFFKEDFGYLPEPNDHIYFETWEEALEDGLQKALKLIIVT